MNAQVPSTRINCGAHGHIGVNSGIFFLYRFLVRLSLKNRYNGPEVPAGG